MRVAVTIVVSDCGMLILGTTSLRLEVVGPAVAFSPDGQLLANAYGGDSIIGTIGLWDVHTGELRHILKEYHGLLTCLAFSPDGKTLVSSSGDSEIIFWDIPTAQRRLQPYDTTHRMLFLLLRFLPMAKHLRAVVMIRRSDLWDPHTGERKADIADIQIMSPLLHFLPMVDTPCGRVEWTGQNNRIQLIRYGDTPTF